ncbi:MAG: FAD-linked oxidase C-terminal domain-containing protein [Armatimonadota bacterium]|nr:FAD-linked oxidase C-terminal domain-containing protein [Armatimonadota bacterium]MDR7452697.1 FAD-linked oxidase C-terminal domain-containing protein [Armatimonadota bacterium]MDR7467302.1 FAD-linked oxidase C-terminal domain-containing protein [Armatimonadota bacterium]MDR7494563.1 FAD-linked oxidase C-terminal domain-containing protein [Armatimonadota bacterium]MDR7504470.1 FAD-linked oxidase C-terminal domain-containing protein [Armatimonadota bacterium]
MTTKIDRGTLVSRLREIVGPAQVLARPEDLVVYEQDACLVARAAPDLAVLPDSADQVAGIVALARRAGIPLVPRGAGTGLNGGSIPVAGGVMLVLTRMNRILELSPRDRLAVVEPGVVNGDLTVAASRHGLFYAPDPGSQGASTIGGNVGNNAGGPHCLAYGVTGNHVLELEVVLPSGEIVVVGSPAVDAPGYDLAGLLVGSEGTLGIITRITVRLLRSAEAAGTLLAAFDTIEDASQTVSEIIAAGIVPTAMEMIDGTVIRAVEAAIRAGYPEDAGAVLLIDVEGHVEVVPRTLARIREIAARHAPRQLRAAETPDDRERLWKGRKEGVGALGRLAPAYYLQDGVVPRTRLPEVMRRVAEIARAFDLVIGNIFHAGDGNLHPTILFDPTRPGMLEQVIAAGEEILKACVACGGSITGEHGVGIEKRDYMRWLFTDADLEAMGRVKAAFDPEGLLNPEKLLPPPAAASSPGRAASEASGRPQAAGWS